MKDIEGIIHDYRITYKRDAEGDLRYYRALNSLDTAIVAAGQAKRADGKRHSHQYRIKQEVLDRVTEKLITVGCTTNCTDRFVDVG